MFKKIYEKLFAKALKAEKEKHEAELKAARDEARQLNDLLCAAEKTQADLMKEINELEDRLADAKWKLSLAEDKVEQLKSASSAEHQNKFAGVKAVTFFTTLAQKTTEELRNMHSNYEVASHEEGWSVTEGYCSHCGCDLLKVFCDERTALLYALLRTAFGQTPKNGLCPGCHSECKNGGF